MRRAVCGVRVRRPARGFVLLGVLAVLTLAALAAVHVGQRRAEQRQRDAEEELLFVGEQFRAAIEAYWRDSPARARALPRSLDDLLLDPRFPQPRRHLRRLYADPLEPGREWGLVRQGGAIAGVYSQAAGEPFRKVGFREAQAGFENALQYADWRFVARLPVTPPALGKPSTSP